MGSISLAAGSMHGSSMHGGSVHNSSSMLVAGMVGGRVPGARPDSMGSVGEVGGAMQPPVGMLPRTWSLQHHAHLNRLALSMVPAGGEPTPGVAVAAARLSQGSKDSGASRGSTPRARGTSGPLQQVG